VESATDRRRRCSGSPRGRVHWLTLTSLCLAACLTVALGAACSSQPSDGTRDSLARALYGPEQTLKLNGNVLTVTNHTGQDWSNIEILLNTYYRVAASSIRAGESAQVPLGTFIDGYSRPFDPARATSRNVHLTAKMPDGKTFEVTRSLH